MTYPERPDDTWLREGGNEEVADYITALLGERDRLAAEVRAQQGRTCNTCDGQQRVYFPTPWCVPLTTIARGKYPVYCKDVGYTCGAWGERDSATSVNKETE